MIERYGGRYIPPDNFHYADSLYWVLDAIQYPVFGVLPYDTFPKKATILTWTIINNHIFLDGNKRTGLATLIHFSNENGYGLSINKQDIVEMGITIAKYRTNGFTKEDFEGWIIEKLIS